MFQNVLQESWVYQEILEKGREEERQRQLQTLMSFLQTRFPEVMTLAEQQTKSIKEPEVLQTVITKMFTAQTVEDAKQILLDLNKP